MVPLSNQMTALYRYRDLFFVHTPATTEISTLSLHDALPIWYRGPGVRLRPRPAPRLPARLLRPGAVQRADLHRRRRATDRKSTRLNSSHGYISYAVFCLKKKKKPDQGASSHDEISSSSHHSY